LVALGLAVALQVAYILLFSPFVTVDAAAHLASAAALVDSVSGFEVGDRFLEWNASPEPNLLAILLLAALIPLVGLAAAETLVLIGYVVALAAAAWYAVRAAPGSEWLVLFVLPLTFSVSFLWGFLSFSYSVAVFLVIAGFLLRTEVSMPSRRTVALAALLVLVFFTHFVGFLASGLLVLLVLAARAFLAPAHRATIVARGAAALMPAVLLALVFVVSSSSASVTSWGSPVRRLAGLVTLKSGLVAYDRLELVFSLAVAGALCTLIVVSVARRRPWLEREADTIALGVFTVAVGLVTILAPYSVGSGGSILAPRLVLFSVLGAVLWLARQRLSPRHILAGGVVAAVAAAGLAVVRYDEHRHMERVAGDLEAITACVARGSTIVQGNLAYVPFSYSEFDPHSAEAGRVAAERDALDLGNSDWGIPFSLQRFRPETNPYTHLVEPGAFIEDVPPPLDFEAFERRTGTRVDYVLLWGRPKTSEQTRASSAWSRFEEDLRSDYALARRSPLGWWELWARAGVECAPTAL
jgi:hypothetical protein